MKEIKKYAEEVATLVKDYFPEAEVNVIEVRKGRTICNQVSVIDPEESAGINVTLNDFFPLLSAENAAEKVAEVVRNNKEQVSGLQSLLGNLSSYRSLSSKIYIRLYSSEMSIEYPYKMIAEDLAAVCYVELDSCPESGESMTANVTHAMLNAWGVSFETVLEDARDNMEKKYDYRSMDAVMKEIMDNMVKSEMISEEAAELTLKDGMGSPLSVLTNKEKVLGAGMLAVPEVLKKAFGSMPQLILPSSVHEAITMPYGIFPVEEAKEIVRVVNVEQVAPEDQLSDSVYIYINGDLKKL